MNETRRGFLTSAAVAGLASASAETPMPTVRLGKYEMSRLVLGSNALAGASHFNPILDGFMREWMTPERVMEILTRSEEAGIRAWQLHTDPKLLDCLQKFRAEGGKMNCFSLCDYRKPIQSIQQLADLGVMGVVYHGELSDVKLRQNKMEDVHEFLKVARDAGLMVGVSMHNPAVLDYVEGKGWDTDFYMTCVYHRSRTKDEQRAYIGQAIVGEPYFEKDPGRMCKMMRQTDKPCFAFKILAAGRNIKRPQAIDETFRFIFENIKPQDGVIVGMFPRFKDEITENAALTRRHGAAKA
jgi:hypothetical protein